MCPLAPLPLPYRPCPLTPHPQDDPFDARRGYQPYEIRHLEMPTSTNNIRDQW